MSDASPSRPARVAKSDWPALVLAAGLGTRLQPLSDVRAKPALPIAGVPLISRILRWLRASDVRRVVINLHHRGDSITRIVGDGSQFDLHVRYSWETEILGSAGGPARAIPLLQADRFLIVNGDMITNVDVRALAEQHLQTNALVTMAVIDGLPGYNGVIADDRGIVKGFGRERGAFHFIGVQAVNASVFASVSPDTRSETVHGIYPPLIASRPESVRVFHSAAEYFDIGSPKDYLDTTMAMARREGRPLDRGIDCSVADDATVTDTILWDRVRIGAGARLTNCIVADDVVVPAGSKYSHSVLVLGQNGLSAHRWNPV
jgi:NDP-sugar pyrophosphorylase family protein